MKRPSDRATTSALICTGSPCSGVDFAPTSISQGRPDPGLVAPRRGPRDRRCRAPRRPAGRPRGRCAAARCCRRGEPPPVLSLRSAKMGGVAPGPVRPRRWLRRWVSDEPGQMARRSQIQAPSPSASLLRAAGVAVGRQVDGGPPCRGWSGEGVAGWRSSSRPPRAGPRCARARRWRCSSAGCAVTWFSPQQSGSWCRARAGFRPSVSMRWRMPAHWRARSSWSISG